MKILPGIFLSIIVATIGHFLSIYVGQNLLGFSKSPISPIMLAILIGFLIKNLLMSSKNFDPGLDFILNVILKIGITFLGIKISLGVFLKVGISGIPIIAICISTGMLVVLFFGHRMKIPITLSLLVAAGTAICGATAIVIISKSINAKKEEISYAVACITIFGLIAMFLNPFIARYLFFKNEISAGLFLGTSIHETAQVAGAGLIYSQYFNSSSVLDIAATTKLFRNMSMFFILPLISFFFQDKDPLEVKRKVSIFDLIPIFILGFLVMGFLRVIGDYTLESSGLAFGYLSPFVWNNLISALGECAKFFLTISMAAIGLTTNFKKLRVIGIKPLFVGLIATITVSFMSIITLNIFM